MGYLTGFTNVPQAFYCYFQALGLGCAKFVTVIFKDDAWEQRESLEAES